MQQQINDIREQQKKDGELLRVIHESVTGDVSGRGIVDRLDDVEKYQSADKKQKWMIAGAVALLGIIGRYWDKIFS